MQTSRTLSGQLLSRQVAPRLRLRVARAAATSYGTDVEQLRHITKDGWGLELLLQRPKTETVYPPLLFVHGSYHGAWCFAERFLPYFAEHGFTSYAVSLRAQGNSDCVSRDKISLDLVAGTLDSHAEDLADLISNISPAPVVISHSFGGLILQKYIQRMASEPAAPGLPPIVGAAFLNSVPPSGNSQMVGRFLRRDLLLSLKVTWGFVAKSFMKNKDTCKELFFSKDIPQADLERYWAELAKCSPVRLIDLNDVNRQVPLPPPPPYAPPAFVLGGEDDLVVDVEAIKELASTYRVEPIILPRLAHDCMLDTRWQEVASLLEAWLKKL